MKNIVLPFLLLLAVSSTLPQTPYVQAGADSRWVLTVDDTVTLRNGSWGGGDSIITVDLVRNGIFPMLRPTLIYRIVDSAGGGPNVEAAMLFEYCFQPSYTHCVNYLKNPADSVLRVDTLYTTPADTGNHYKQLNSPELARSVRIRLRETANTVQNRTIRYILKDVRGR